MLFHHVQQNAWYLFYFDDGLNRERLYVADDLLAKWQEHPESGKYAVRHSGKIHHDETGKMWCLDHSGSPHVVNKIEMVVLDRQSYVQRSASQLTLSGLAGQNASRTWGEQGMHTFNSVYDEDKKMWYAVIDGWWNDKKKSIFSCLRNRNTNEKCHTVAGHLGNWEKKPPKSLNAPLTTKARKRKPSVLEQPLRVLVLTMNRPGSLERLLLSLQNAVSIAKEK